MSTLILNLSLSYNPEDVPTSYSLHVNSITEGYVHYRVIGTGECDTEPNDENQLQIALVIEECANEEECASFVLPLFNLDITDPEQEIVVTASSDASRTGQGSIKSVEAQNETRPIG